MSMKDEFKAFVMKGNVVDLAIAVVVGGAFGKIITAFVDGIVMPLVTYVLPANIKWEEWILGKFVKKEEAAAPAEPTTKECPACLEQVPLKATRCKHCTSQL